MNTDEIRERRGKLLDETIARFNLNNRSFNGSICTYAPTDKSDGCAVGRLISDKTICEELDKHGINADNKRVLEALPTEIRELGGDFLRSLQQLHDFPHNWEETGLSIRGEIRVAELRNLYIN